MDSFDKKHDSCHKATLKRGISHMQYPDWLKNKKAIITTKNKDEECFNLLSQLLYIMKNLIIIQKKSIILNLLLINMIEINF